MKLLKNTKLMLLISIILIVISFFANVANILYSVARYGNFFGYRASSVLSQLLSVNYIIVICLISILLSKKINFKIVHGIIFGSFLIKGLFSFIRMFNIVITPHLCVSGECYAYKMYSSYSVISSLVFMLLPIIIGLLIYGYKKFNKNSYNAIYIAGLALTAFLFIITSIYYLYAMINYRHYISSIFSVINGLSSILFLLPLLTYFKQYGEYKLERNK